MVVKHIFIMNPAAGKGAAAKKLSEAINDACRAAGVQYEIYKTVGQGDATRFVRERISSKPEDEIYRFYACGGDGTLSEVVCGAANPDADKCPGALKNIEVGCIPVGTGNDFVRNFKNREFFSDITKQLLADSTLIDCYLCSDGNIGVNMINIGFDCDVVVNAAELKKNPLLPRGLAYIAGIASTLKKNLGRVITAKLADGTEITREFQLVSAANGGFCGGGFHSAPGSSLNDGLLDVSLINKVSRFDFIRLVGAYKKGTHLETKLGKKVVHYAKVKSVAFEFSEPANVCVDGEVRRLDRLALSVLPRAIAFAVPVGCEII